MTFEARYHGHCHACDQRITPGEAVTYAEDGELIHGECHAVIGDDQATTAVCATCWTDHAGECL